MRLSDNLVFRWFSSFYVEVVRNVPLLLQLFFWYFAVLRAMPSKREKLELVEGVAGLNITGLYLPAPIVSDGFIYSFIVPYRCNCYYLSGAAVCVEAAGETGQILPMFWIGLGIIIILPVLVHYLNGSPLDWSLPEFKDTGPKLRQGYQSGAGMVLVPEMLAVWLALSLYTAAFIAEIVRAGILGC